MKRHLIFKKCVYSLNAMLETEKCKNEGSWIISCDDNLEVMQTLQDAYSKANSDNRLKICFANPDNYSDFVEVI